MAELSYRDAVAAGIAQEMRRDPTVVMLGEDIAAAGGVFKTTVGLLDEFGPQRIRDTPISERRSSGRPWGGDDRDPGDRRDHVLRLPRRVLGHRRQRDAKSRYMTGGQVSIPVVIRTANGGGSRFGAQHTSRSRTGP